MTAEELLEQKFSNGHFIEIHSGDVEDIKDTMIEFAKFHVQIALEVINEKAKNSTIDEIVENKLLTTYFLENIK